MTVARPDVSNDDLPMSFTLEVTRVAGGSWLVKCPTYPEAVDVLSRSLVMALGCVPGSLRDSRFDYHYVTEPATGELVRVDPVGPVRGWDKTA